MRDSLSPLLVMVLLTLALSGCGGPVPTEPPVEPPAAAPTEAPAPEGCSLGDTQVRPADGAVLVCVPSGEFQMGSSDADVDAVLDLCNQRQGNCDRSSFEIERPAHAVALDGFWMDRTEVTNAQYALCVAAGACDPPSSSESYSRDPYYGESAYADYPVIYVTWYSATAYCEWVGGRLPTEAEWEYAARGPEGVDYPWGDTFDGTRLNYCDANCGGFSWRDGSYDDGYANTAPVGSYPAGNSWVGAADLGGNVSEWMADGYGEYPAERQQNPAGPSSGEFQPSLRGGSWYGNFAANRSAFRSWYFPNFTLGYLGFRCVGEIQ